MVSETNFHMVKNFNFKPEHFGVLNEKEIQTIKNHFKIEERNNTELQNLRDFVVLYYSTINKVHDIYTSDLVSGIVGVIDDEKWNRGMVI